jgi:hypothetical protein
MTPPTGSATALPCRCPRSRPPGTHISLWARARSARARCRCVGMSGRHARRPSAPARPPSGRRRCCARPASPTPAGELVNHVQQPDNTPIGGLVMPEVQRPHLVGSLRAQPLGGERRLSQPPALTLADWHAQPLLAPDSLHPPAVDLPALLAQPMMHAAVTPTALRRSRAASRAAPRRPWRASARGVAWSDAAPPPGTPSAR